MQKIMIHSAGDLTTKFDGQTGWLIKRGFMGHSEYCKVLTFCGKEIVLHESQIEELK